MLDTSQSWYQAITADARRILISAIISIIDPDMEYGAVTSQSAAPYSQPEQIHDKEFTLMPYATLEDNRWVLDGTFSLVPDNNQPTGQVAYVSGDLCGADGTFATAQYVEMGFSNVSILQACTIFFPEADYDGVADSFTGICGNLAEKVSGTFDIVAANIVADVVILLTKDAPRFMKPDTVYILSGIIDTREDDVLACLADRFELIDRREEKGWVALAAKLR